MAGRLLVAAWSQNAFDSPNTGKEGQISWDGSPHYCMDVNTASDPVILMENCQGRAAEEWYVIGGDTNFGNVTVPAYVYQSAAYPSLCLTAPNVTGDVCAKPCNFNAQDQNWMQCQGTLCSASS